MRYFVMLGTLLLSLTSFANERTLSEMRTLALNVFQSAMSKNSSLAKGVATSSVSLSDVILEKEGKEYSVFTNKDKGSVIVSKSTDEEPILGYSFNSTSYDEMPAALKFYLEAYDNSAIHEAHASARSISAIAPFVTTQWGQQTPYNDLCPEINGKKAPCGCSAIATSQILNYMKMPDRFYFSSTYTVGDDPQANNVNVKDSITYPFLDKYEEGAYTEAEGNAVATFVRDCGYAVNMNYNTGGSGAYINDVMTAAMARFGFPKEAIKVYNKAVYSAEEWDDIIFGELEKGYPIYYTGHDANGNNGHAFVVCGCDEEGKIYVNWGWNGKYDGYFSMSLLIPVTGDNFSYNTNTVQGFHPQKLDTDEVEMVFGAPGLYVFTTTSTGLNVNLPDGLWNYSNTAYTINICALAENVETGKKKYSSVTTRQTTYATYYGTAAGDYPFVMSGLTEGKYRLSLVAKKNTFPIEYVPIRTVGGLVYYDLTVAADGTMTIGTEAKSLSTGINDVKIADTYKSTKAYSITGQQVGNTYHGIKIQNGKKILVK